LAQRVTAAAEDIEQQQYQQLIGGRLSKIVPGNQID